MTYEERLVWSATSDDLRAAARDANLGPDNMKSLSRHQLVNLVNQGISGRYRKQIVEDLETAASIRRMK
jgi:hypothetical protein